MTREEAKSRLRHIAEDMFAVDDVRAIHTLIEYIEAYENADLIERGDAMNVLIELENNRERFPLEKQVATVVATRFSVVGRKAMCDIPRFEPTEGSDK